MTAESAVSNATSYYTNAQKTPVAKRKKKKNEQSQRCAVSVPIHNLGLFQNIYKKNS